MFAARDGYWKACSGFPASPSKLICLRCALSPPPLQVPCVCNDQRCKMVTSTMALVYEVSCLVELH